MFSGFLSFSGVTVNEMPGKDGLPKHLKALIAKGDMTSTKTVGKRIA